MKLLLYTFRTYPNIIPLRRFCPQIHVLGQLKNDLASVSTEISQDPPDLIFGIAQIKKGLSRLETEAINQFNKTKTINPGGTAKFDLWIPPQLPKGFTTSNKPTDSFCNWTAYKIAEITKKSGIPSAFVHLRDRDLTALLTFLHACADAPRVPQIPDRGTYQSSAAR